MTAASTMKTVASDTRRQETAAGAPPGGMLLDRPAARFVAAIEALWSLGALGQVNAKGMPDPPWLAAVGHEYRDAIRFLRPPAPVQAAVFAPLAALARRTGRDPLAPELHGPGAACVIADPGEDGLANLLTQPVQTPRGTRTQMTRKSGAVRVFEDGYGQPQPRG